MYPARRPMMEYGGDWRWQPPPRQFPAMPHSRTFHEIQRRPVMMVSASPPPRRRDRPARRGRYDEIDDLDLPDDERDELDKYLDKKNGNGDRKSHKWRITDVSVLSPEEAAEADLLPPPSRSLPPPRAGPMYDPYMPPQFPPADPYRMQPFYPRPPPQLPPSGYYPY